MTVSTIGAINKDIESKQKFCNHFHSILGLLDVLPNFLLITSEMMHNYYLKIGYIWVALQVAEWLKI